MKQATMESVKQRIAHIEDLNARGVGTKVQQQQFELACLRELVAVTEQRDAVVAENSQIKAINDCLAEELRSYESDGAFEGPDMHLLWWKCEFKATDAAIAALRAEGIHFTANRLLAAYDHGFINKPAKEVADVARMIITAIDELPTATPEDLTDSYSKQSLAEIARQLRESKGANHEA